MAFLIEALHIGVAKIVIKSILEKLATIFIAAQGVFQMNKQTKVIQSKIRKRLEFATTAFCKGRYFAKCSSCYRIFRYSHTRFLKCANSFETIQYKCSRCVL